MVEYIKDGQPVDVHGNPLGQPQVQQAAFPPPQQAFAPPFPQAPFAPQMYPQQQPQQPQQQPYQQPQQPLAPAPRIAGGDYAGDQRVEIYGGAPQPPQQNTPVSNQPAQFIHAQPTLSTEAGRQVITPPGTFAAPPSNGTPQTIDEARRMIPIPLADS